MYKVYVQLEKIKIYIVQPTMYFVQITKKKLTNTLYNRHCTLYKIIQDKNKNEKETNIRNRRSVSW
jgi:hypothetical protein